MLRNKHQMLAVTLEAMLQDIGAKFVPKPEERLLAVVNALLHRCYKVGICLFLGLSPCRSYCVRACTTGIETPVMLRESLLRCSSLSSLGSTFDLNLSIICSPSSIVHSNSRRWEFVWGWITEATFVEGRKRIWYLLYGRLVDHMSVSSSHTRRCFTFKLLSTLPHNHSSSDSCEITPRLRCYHGRVHLFTVTQLNHIAPVKPK